MSAKKTVLVVDDDPDIVEQLEATLGSAGFRVVAAGSEAEAEDLLLTVRPDVAIIDLMMEHMDSGFVLGHRLRKLHPGTPVVLLTGVTAHTGLSFATQSESAASWLTVDKVLDKPVRREELLTHIRHLLGEAEEAPGPNPHG